MRGFQTEDKVSKGTLFSFYVWKRREKYGIIEIRKEG